MPPNMKLPQRNDPCWCGSGRKYKKCHLGRESLPRLKPWEADADLKRAASVKYCLAPDALKGECSGQVVRAHTVPKRGSLRQIARNGHVYSAFPIDVRSLDRNLGTIQPRLLGINRASTFTGFCSVHDKSIFRKVEDEPFAASREQCFLLGYRAFAREIFFKKAAAQVLSGLRDADRGMPFEDQLALQTQTRKMNDGTSACLRDNVQEKARYDKILTNRNFELVRAYVILLEDAPPVMCSGAFFPEHDFDGNHLQDLLKLDVKVDMLTLSSFYGGENGAVVFTWLPGENAACERFISSLKGIPGNLLTDALVRLLFNFENLHISPDWWESLTESQRSSLTLRLTASSHPAIERLGLEEDGISYGNWHINGSFSVGL